MGINTEAYAVGMGISASNFWVRNRTGVPSFRHRTDFFVPLPNDRLPDSPGDQRYRTDPMPDWHSWITVEMPMPE